MGNIARTCCYVHAKNVVVYLEWKTLHAVIFKRFRLKVTRKWEAFSLKMSRVITSLREKYTNFMIP